MKKDSTFEAPTAGPLLAAGDDASAPLPGFGAPLPLMIDDEDDDDTPPRPAELARAGRLGGTLVLHDAPVSDMNVHITRKVMIHARSTHTHEVKLTTNVVHLDTSQRLFKSFRRVLMFNIFRSNDSLDVLIKFQKTNECLSTQFCRCVALLSLKRTPCVCALG